MTSQTACPQDLVDVTICLYQGSSTSNAEQPLFGQVIIAESDSQRFLRDL